MSRLCSGTSPHAVLYGGTRCTRGDAPATDSGLSRTRKKNHLDPPGGVDRRPPPFIQSRSAGKPCHPHRRRRIPLPRAQSFEIGFGTLFAPVSHLHIHFRPAACRASFRTGFDFFGGVRAADTVLAQRLAVLFALKMFGRGAIFAVRRTCFHRFHTQRRAVFGLPALRRLAETFLSGIARHGFSVPFRYDSDCFPVRRDRFHGFRRRRRRQRRFRRVFLISRLTAGAAAKHDGEDGTNRPQCEFAVHFPPCWLDANLRPRIDKIQVHTHFFAKKLLPFNLLMSSGQDIKRI